MEVRGPGSVFSAGVVGRVAPASTVATSGPTAVSPQFVQPKDEVEISSAARMLDAASRAGGIHEQRLEQIKAAIAAGTYETPEKLSLAVERMLSGLASEEAGGI